MQIGFDVALPYQNGRFDLERAGTREALCLSSHQGGRIAAAKSMPGDFRNWRREVPTSWQSRDIARSLSCSANLSARPIAIEQSGA